MTNPEVYQGGHEALLRQQEIFHEKISLNQELINSHEREGTFTDEMVRGIIDDIDGDCPYLNQPVLISGLALVPVIDQETYEVNEEVWDKVVHQGLHMGINIVRDEDGRSMIVQAINIGTATVQSQSTCIDVRKYFAYFTNGANITPLVELESIYSPHYLAPHQGSAEDYMRGFGIVLQKSNELVSLLGDTKFRRMDRRKQIRLLDRLISEASEEASVADQDVAVEAEYGYVLELESDHRLELGKISLGKYVVSGQCIAIDSLELIRLPVQRIKSDRELLDKKAGLCMVIDPDEDTRDGLELNSAQTLFVPANKIQKLAVLDS